MQKVLGEQNIQIVNIDRIRIFLKFSFGLQLQYGSTIR